MKNENYKFLINGWAKLRNEEILLEWERNKALWTRNSTFFPLVLGRSTDEKETCKESEMETKTTLMGVSKDFYL